MTNALSQDIQKNPTDILLNVVQNINIDSMDRTKNSSGSEFSNMMNTLNAKTKKTESDFITSAGNANAQKTNTSSINKKALTYF